MERVRLPVGLQKFRCLTRCVWQQDVKVYDWNPATAAATETETVRAQVSTTTIDPAPTARDLSRPFFPLLCLMTLYILFYSMQLRTLYTLALPFASVPMRVSLALLLYHVSSVLGRRCESSHSPGTHWIASSIRSSDTAASYADFRLLTLLIVGSRTPAVTLSRTSPFIRSRPYRKSAFLGSPAGAFCAAL